MILETIGLASQMGFGKGGLGSMLSGGGGLFGGKPADSSMAVSSATSGTTTFGDFNINAGSKWFWITAAVAGIVGIVAFVKLKKRIK